MTQLYIDQVEVVLPQSFSCTVKRENPFFTKSGEYTYDVTLRLDNPTNLTLYGFLNRTNKSDTVDTDRTAVLVADGHVYCRGREVITRWTESTVTIQIVSGESELNFFIGQDKKIEDLDMGTVSTDADCCFPVVKTPANTFLNVERVAYGVNNVLHRREWRRDVPQPYLCTIIDRLVKALGYTVGKNQLRDTLFRNLFIVNATGSDNLQKILAGWTVKDFLSEVEKLTGIVFVTDNVKKTCDIVQKTAYYAESRQLPLSNVVDAYETEVADDGSGDEEFTASNVSYDLPDGRWSKLMKLPDYLPQAVKRVEFGNFATLRSYADKQTGSTQELLVDTSTGRTYISARREVASIKKAEDQPKFLIEVDQFCDLDREDASSTLELKIVPAPLAPTYVIRAGIEFIDLGTNDSYLDFLGDEVEGDAGTEDGGDGIKDTIEDTIREASKSETSAVDLYCAFYNGATWNNFPQPYTDAYHATMRTAMAFYAGNYNPGAPEGSLRLKDLDADYYQGGYEIDTRHAMTFETFDPNVIDVRQVYVIRNRRFVVRDAEEVVTAEGRQKKWRVTCYPIKVSDEAILKRWVLTRGVWDDGAAWLDDGRWIDDPI